MIIAGYPCIGKTTYASERTDVLDMSLVLNFVGNDLIHVDPEYARKNADAIVEKQKKFRHVLIPIEDSVLAELSRRGVPYTVVVPDPRDEINKEEYAVRLAGKSQEFIDEHIGKWEEHLSQIIKTYDHVILLRHGFAFSFLMSRIDAQLDRISVKAAYTGELLDAKRADGTPYEEGNRHLNRVGQSGTVAFLDGVFPGYPTIAFFITGTGHLRTSPGEVYRSTGPEGDMVTIHTENSLYTWRIDSVIPQEKYQGLVERFIFRRDGYR